MDGTIDFGEYVTLEDIPEVDLYMDQVIQIFEQKLSRGKRRKEDKVLTKTMINNYAKAKLLMKVKNKKYTKEHVLLMSLIYELKGSLSINDIKDILSPIVQEYDNNEEYPLRDVYKEVLKINEENKSFFNEKNQSLYSKDFDNYEEKLLEVYKLVNLSNMYRKAAETIVDRYLVEGEE